MKTKPLKNFIRRAAAALTVVHILLGLFLPVSSPKSVNASESSLSGCNLAAYEYVRAELIKVATGERSSTCITVPLSVLGMDGEITAADLGLDYIALYDSATDTWSYNPGLSAAISSTFPLDPLLIMNELFRNLPYHCYWASGKCIYNNPTSSRTFTYRSSTGVVMEFRNDFEMNFSVSKGYCSTFSAAEDSYIVDMGVPTAMYGMTKAKNIVQAASGLSDHDKLLYYATTIISLTDYNYEAIENSWDRDVRGPWEPVWVFDDDPSTKVVCQGYARAFQYLCDLSTFSNPGIKVRTASGNLDAPGVNGSHIWNIVTMEDGKNYLVDVTNCDQGGDAYDTSLFLAPAQSGSAASTYTFPVPGATYKYTYDDVTKTLYTLGELTLSSTAYGGAYAPAPTATNTPTPTATNTPTPTATSTPTPTATSTPTPTATNTPTPAATNTPTPAATNTPTPAATSTPVPTAIDTPAPTATDIPAPTATPAPAPTVTDTPVPTATPAPAVTDTPTPVPDQTEAPTASVTDTPTPIPVNDIVTPQPDPSFSGTDPSEGTGGSEGTHSFSGVLSGLLNGILIAAGAAVGLIVVIVVVTIVICKKK